MQCPLCFDNDARLVPYDADDAAVGYREHGDLLVCRCGTFTADEVDRILVTI